MENELRQRQKDEALKRMELLKLNKSVIRDFKEKDKIYYSERQNALFDGILYWLDNNNEWVEMVKKFESSRNALVYHAQFTRTVYGDCLSLLFVSKFEDEWGLEHQDILDERAVAYVINLDDPDLSEMGYIGLVSKNGGVSRTY